MQDLPPQNRAQRRAAAHKKPTAPMLARVGGRPSPSSRNADHGPDTGTGAPSASAETDETDEAEDDTPSAFQRAFMSGGADAAPTRRKAASHHRGGSKQQRVRDGLVSYYGFAGMIVMSRNQTDGMLILSQAEKLADAWIEAGKSSPEIMRVLEIITIAGPYTALVMIHAKLALDLMGNHGTSPLALFARGNRAADPSDEQHAPGAAPAALPYQPVGPFAATDHTTTQAPPPMPSPADGLRVYPEEGLPADLDVALRQAARESGRPYSELRDQALLELAQMRMAQNGHTVAPGALGAPVAKG